MTTNLHDKMLAAIDALFSASDAVEEEVAENLLLDVRDELLKQYRKAMQDALVGGTGIMKGGERIDPASIYAQQDIPDYAWPTVQDYEADVGFKVNDAFQMGWDMARTTNDLFRQMGAAHE